VLQSPRGALPFEKQGGWVPWRSGPSNPQGKQCDLSDRPFLCSAAHWGRNEVVVGSSDHALYLMDAITGNRKRTLYTKNAGHTEWVTACCFLPDGKIVSGGMDSKLWLWPTGSTHGISMDGHFGAISKLGWYSPTSDANSGLVCSASYDRTVRLWTVGSRGSELACLKGHEAPVTELSLGQERGILSGDRSGNVILWDAAVANGLEAAYGGEAWRLKNIHRGHITSLCWWYNSHEPNFGGLFMSGGQDGVLRVWDRRNKSNVSKVQLHVNEKGHGAVSNICAGRLPSSQGFIVTAGADGTVRVLDPRKSFAPAGQPIQLTNFPYALAAVPYNGTGGGMVACGCGDGSIHIIDISAAMSSSSSSINQVSPRSSNSSSRSRPPWSSGGQEGDVEGSKSATCYALGAHRGAVRTLEVCEDRLMSSGDDGNTMLYFFD
jgi:WD40 repeat protein